VGSRLGATVTALAALALVGYVCVTHADDVGRAFAAVPAWAVGITWWSMTPLCRAQAAFASM
jgi:hypothetical protein